MTRFRALFLCLALCLSTAAGAGQQSSFPADRVLTHREQATLVKGWIQKRFDTEVQKATDQSIHDIDVMLTQKEKEIMTV